MLFDLYEGIESSSLNYVNIKCAGIPGKRKAVQEQYQWP
jgi:hypothetical protein